VKTSNLTNETVFNLKDIIRITIRIRLNCNGVPIKVHMEGGREGGRTQGVLGVHGVLGAQGSCCSSCFVADNQRNGQAVWELTGLLDCRLWGSQMVAVAVEGMSAHGEARGIAHHPSRQRRVTRRGGDL
jgi:hypothetical protein